MGKEKYLKKIEQLFLKSPLVSYVSIRKHVNNNDYAKLLVHNLIVKGKIRKVTKGLYTSKKNPQLCIFAFMPAYFGLQDALSQHDLWEQETIPVIVTARKMRTGIRQVMGLNVLVRRIDKKLMFGFEHVQQGEIYVPYSDIEKTFIDMVYFKEKLDDGSLKSMRKTINRQKLRTYLKNYPEKFREKVLELLDK